MKSLIAAAVLGALVLGAAVPTWVEGRQARAAPTATPGRAPLSPEALDAFVSGVTADAMKSEHVAGLSVAIVQNGRPVLAKGYGAASFAPYRPVTPETLFRLGSTTKTFTWIALMREVEKGRVSLDDPVNRYLPADLRFPDSGFTRPIRLRDLMDHASGVEDGELDGMIVSDPRKVVSLERYLRTHRPRRVREPGADPSYCNYCAALAGYVVARLEGADYETVIRRDIFAPLGMTSTTLADPRPAVAGLPATMPAELANRTSDGFTWTGDDFRKDPIELAAQIAPAGAAWSNANDMTRYMIAQLNGGTLDGARIYGPATAAALRTPLLKTAPGVNGWDHGFVQLPLPGGFTGYGHGGDTALFHGDMVLVPELGLGVFVATNTSTGPTLAKRLTDLVVEHFYGGAPPAAAGPVDPARLRPYEGAWMGTRRAYHGLEGFIGLMQETDLSATTAGLAGYAPGRLFLPDGPAGRLRQKDGQDVLVFDMKDGRAVKFRASNNAQQFERVPGWMSLNVYASVIGCAVIAALATLIGFFVRRRDLPSTGAQAWASRLQGAAAAGWIAALGLFGAWVAGASDLTVLLNWPGPLITGFAWSGLAAALLSAAGVLMLAQVWTGTGWSGWRKLRYSTTAALFAALTLLTFLRGGLDVWTL
jgi:CubicO group peptidase (beta-lactamase class C family)